jgi:phage tail-like protein
VSRPPASLAAAPPTASQREYLRAGLPTLYREPGSLAMGFVGALEEVLDPIVAVLDNLHAHLDADVAPPRLLDAIASWLGLWIDDEVDVPARRELVKSAIELAPEFRDEDGRLQGRGAKGGVIRQRGTKDGLELALRLSFPTLGLTVQNAGTVSIGAHGEEWAPPAGTFVVHSVVAPDPRQRQAIDRIVRDMKPVGVSYLLDAPEADDDREDDGEARAS